MMPDLDRYAGTVLGAYGVTLALLAAPRRPELVARACGSAAGSPRSRSRHRRPRWPGLSSTS